MAEKKNMHVATAAAVARVKEQSSFSGKWGAPEHCAGQRYLTTDAIVRFEKNPKVRVVGTDKKEVEATVVFKATAGAGEVTLQDAINSHLRAVYAADPEWAYASNMQKLLEKCGEIAVAADYQ